MTAENRTANVDHGPETGSIKHTVPPLPYDYDALEPCIDARTMMLHHDHHHASYVAALNSALENCPELQGRSAYWLLLNPGAVPPESATLIHNNAGGHVNHSLFWKTMSPAGQVASAPAGALASAIDRDFGSLEQFKQQFVDAGENQFGSGWVWLVESRLEGSKLEIRTTRGHDNPLMDGCLPILLNDVWEHAYYLNYQNLRGDYLRAWWSVVNWEEATRRFGRSSDQSAVRDWEDEGGMIKCLASSVTCF